MGSGRPVGLYTTALSFSGPNQEEQQSSKRDMAKLDLDIIKAKVNAFRIAEAKDVLQQLGMSRSGNKPDLIARIMSVFSDAATLTAHGYRPRDSNRQELAASVIERVHNVQASQGHVPWQARRHISDLEQKAAAKGSAKDDSGVQAEAGSVAGSASAAEGPNKRQKVVSGLQDGPAVDEVITAFLTGADALSNTKVRCICSEHVERGQMLQCEGAFCGVWQHAACVRQHMRNTQPPPGPPGTTSASRQQFYCERCRVARADPFWEIFDPTVMPPAVANKFVKHATVHNALNQPTQVAVHGTGLKSMVLQKSNVMLLRAKPQEYKLMALCLELDDTVPFRIHWPLHANLSFEASNGALVPNVRVMQRPVSHYLGTNQRDEGCDLRPLLPPTGGTNAAGMMRKSLQLELADPQHTYLLLVYMMRRRSREQVKALMKPPEQLAQAVQRVCRHMHGGHNPARQCAAGDAAAPAAAGQPAAAAANGTANGVQTIESDDDDDIIVGNIVVSLKDPMSGARMNVPVRFTDTAGTAPSAFDLDTFLEMAQRSKKWLDPHNQEPSTIQNLQVDSYLAHILACLADNPEVTEIEINPDGQWRPAGSSSDFMSVLDQQKDMAAAAAQAAAAAATVGQAVAAAAAAASDDSDDEDDAEELRRAMAEFAAANQKAQAERAAAAAAAAARKAVDVIDLVSDDEDEQPSAAAAAGVGSMQAAAGSGPLAAANPIQQGLRIRLPQRLPQQHQQQPLQQMQHQQQPGARLAAGTTAAAAVGPPVPHSLGLGALEQQHAGLSRTLSQGAVPGVSGGHHPQQQQQQQVWQQPGLQQQQQHLQQHLAHMGLQNGQYAASQQQQQQQQQIRPMQLPMGSIAMQGQHLPMASLGMQGSLPMQHVVTTSVHMPGQGVAGTQMPVGSWAMQGSMPTASLHMQPSATMQFASVRPVQQQPQQFLQVQRPQMQLQQQVAGQPGSPRYAPPMWVQQQPHGGHQQHLQQQNVLSGQQLQQQPQQYGVVHQGQGGYLGGQQSATVGQVQGDGPILLDDSD